MTAGYWWGHVTSVNAKYTPLNVTQALQEKRCGSIKHKKVFPKLHYFMIDY